MPNLLSHYGVEGSEDASPARSNYFTHSLLSLTLPSYSLTVAAQMAAQSYGRPPAGMPMPSGMPPRGMPGMPGMPGMAPPPPGTLFSTATNFVFLKVIE